METNDRSTLPYSRKMTRWVYKGKSYPTKKKAFMLAAKDCLHNELLPEWTKGFAALPADHTEEDQKWVMFEPYTRMFPMKPESRKYTKKGEPRIFDYDDYKKWLERKAIELMKEAGVF